MSIFAPNPIRATANQIILQFTTEAPPLDLIKIPNLVEEVAAQNEESTEQQQQQVAAAPTYSPGPAPTWSDFLQLVAAHPAVSNACKAGGLKIQENEIRYSIADFSSAASSSAANSTNTTTGFSNRFDSKLYDSFIALLNARDDAAKSREEHDKIMLTREPPTPPVEEHDDDENNNNNHGGGGYRETQYDEDGNEIEVDEDENNNNNNQNGGDANATAAPPPRPRKTRAQRKEEEKQRKEDKKRQHEVEVKEYLVACLEQKLRYALCATAISVSLAP